MPPAKAGSLQKKGGPQSCSSRLGIQTAFGHTSPSCTVGQITLEAFRRSHCLHCNHDLAHRFCAEVLFQPHFQRHLAHTISCLIA